MSTSLRLSDLLTRNVSIQWYEAVALVREVTDRLLELPGSPRVPELHEIEIVPTGQLVLTGGSKGDDPVRRLGQLLQAALAQSDPPVQLRLLMSQATGATPAFESIAEFAHALAYFERPDRHGVLRALYARALSVPEAADEVPVPTLDTIAPLADPEQQRAPQRKKTRKRNTRAQLVGVLAIALLVLGAAYVAIADPAAGQKISTVAMKTSDTLGRAVFAGLSSLSETVGLGRLVSSGAPVSATAPAAVSASAAAHSTPAPVEAPDPKPSQPQTVVRKVSPTTRRAVKAVVPPLPSVAAFDLDPVAPAASEPVRPVGTTAAPSSVSKRDSDDKPRLDATVYSTGAEGVTPPVALRPQLPKELPAHIDRTKLGRIELVVQPDGKVGSVKLLGWPNNVHEAMFLSAVKAWEFSPAVRNGRPVSFRKVVWVAFQ